MACCLKTNLLTGSLSSGWLPGSITNQSKQFARCTAHQNSGCAFSRSLQNFPDRSFNSVRSVCRPLFIRPNFLGPHNRKNGAYLGRSIRTMPWNCTKLPTVTGKAPPECTLEADGCMCSRGCQSTYACSPSALCSRPEARPSGVALKVPIVLFLQFNESLVRHKYAAHPATAYRREFNRILWFVESARRVQTRMPLYVAVGGRRNHSAEAHLQRLGVGIVSLPFVVPPSWSSLFHHFSFSRIAALSLTQFEKVS